MAASRSRRYGAGRGRTGFWQQQGTLVRPRSFGFVTSRRNCGTTRELSGGKHCGYHIRFLRRVRPQSVVQKLQSRTSFISDTPLSEEAAFTLASRSLLTEDPPPSVLLRVASGALIGPSHRVFCGAAQLMAARRRGTVRVWRQEATRYCHKEDARGGVCTEEAAIFRCRTVAFSARAVIGMLESARTPACTR